MLQAIVINNKIFIPCTCIYEESATLYGSVSYEIKGYVTPDLTYFISLDGIDEHIGNIYKIIELNEDSPYRNFQFKDLDIEKLEIPWKYIKQIPTVQGLVKQIEEK